MRRSLSLLAAALLVSCGTEPAADSTETVTISTELGPGSPHRRGVALTVMTRNLYLGADLFRVVEAQGAEAIAMAVSEVFAMVQATDFPARARLIAEEVARTRPDVVGLQEVAIWRTGPGAACAGDLTPRATDVAYDFLEILQGALRHRGLHYEVASEVTSLDIELCDATLQDVRYTDRDVILVRHDVPARDAASGTFQAAAVFPVVLDPTSDPPLVLEIPAPRGWNAVAVERHGRWVRVVETHIEEVLPIEPPWLVQLAQAGEMVATIGAMTQADPLPTVLVGDFNSPADPEFTAPTYGFLAGGQPFPDLGIPDLAPLVGMVSPFQDSWLALWAWNPGFTWGFDEDLRGGTLTERLDLTLGWGVTPRWTMRTGMWSRTCSGLHASDHAGVVTSFAVP